MTWLDEAGAMVVGLAIVLVPGVAIAIALSARWQTALLVSPVGSMAAVALGALVNQLIPYRWGILPFIGASVLVVALSWGVRVLWTRRRPADGVRADRDARGWAGAIAVPIGLVAAASLIAPRLATAFGAPGDISQTFDNVYHLNAVREIVDGGSASPLQQLIPRFYPDEWHALVVVLTSATGIGIPAAVNIVSLLLGAVVWPLGCMLLARQVLGSSPVVTLASAALSAAFAAFPLSMLDFGVLYPNVLAISLLPAVLAFGVAVLRLGTVAPVIGRFADAWLLLIAVPTLALAHPSTLMALFAIGLAPAVFVAVRGAVRRLRAPGRSGAVRWLVAWCAGFLAAGVLFVVARPHFGEAFWPPTDTLWHAFLAAATNGAIERPVPYVVTGLMLIGIVAVIVRRCHRWLAFSFLTIVSLYAICAGFHAGRIRYLFTGTWYSDDVRIAALLPVVALPLAVAGTQWIVELLALAVRRAAHLSPDGGSPTGGVRRVAVRSLVVGLVIGAGVIAASQPGASLTSASDSARASYRISDDSSLLTLDERALLERIGRETPVDTVIAGSPWTGTSLSYVLSDRRALIPHIYWVMTPDDELLAQRLRDADHDPAACAALHRTGVGFVLDFGLSEVHGERHPFPGFEDLAHSSAVRLVDHQGAARLYEVLPCTA